MSTPRVEELLAEALARPGPERARYVREACGSDEALRAEVESLLEAHEEAGEFMGEPSVVIEAGDAQEPLGEGEGATIGRYKLLQRIGEGGFGAVFMAEQREPVRRRVALKIIKLGMDTRQVIARFEAERQALAMMDHPGIARVLDAGATEGGRPYFVMELVRGEPITSFCDRESLPIDARLGLFAQVCAAVQHAHQKGIIHRDLKPSNILVSEIDGRPAPKIIDFGIAKATGGAGQALTDKTLFTDFRQFVGTPEYMSPEQAGRGEVDIDTRSDIYSLGVLLYELLTGGPPFDAGVLRSAAWEEMRRIIREVDPERPSTRLHSRQDTREVATHRGAEPGHLIGLVRGDLDWMVMKCLEKERARRYETASALAEDLSRHLRGEPVLAAPPGRAYRARKFVTRNKGAVAAAGVVSLTLMLGVVGTSLGLAWALRERGRAEQRAVELAMVAEFLKSMLRGVDSQAMGEGIRSEIEDRWRLALQFRGFDEASIEQELDAFRATNDDVNFRDVARAAIGDHIIGSAETQIAESFAEQPLIEATLLDAIASMWIRVGAPDRALNPRLRSLEIRLAELGEHHEDTISALASYGWALVLLGGRETEAAELYLRAIELAEQVHGDKSQQMLILINGLGVALHSDGRYDEHIEWSRRGIEIARRMGRHDMEKGLVGNMAASLLEVGQLEEAETILRERLQDAEDPNSPAWLRERLAMLLLKTGRREEAEPLLKQALDLYKVISDSSWRTATTAHRLSLMLASKGDLAGTDRLQAETCHYVWNDRLEGSELYYAYLLWKHAETRTTLTEFEHAERDLLWASKLVVIPGPDSTAFASRTEIKAGIVRALIDLYEAWHAATPDAGYDRKAAELRAGTDAAPGGDAGRTAPDR